MERTSQNTDLKGKQMRKLLGKIMQYIIANGLAMQGYTEDVSCHYPPEEMS